MSFLLPGPVTALLVGLVLPAVLLAIPPTGPRTGSSAVASRPTTAEPPGPALAAAGVATGAATGAATRAATGATPAPADGAAWPLDPRPDVVTGFSPPADPWGAGHRGVDLLGRVGEPVHSSRAGTVTYVGTIAGVGVVVVRHGTTRTTYQPVHATVHVGQHVEAGQVLGTLTLAGSHCFPSACLHWGLLDGDRYLDPLTLVGAAPVRLLPLP